MKLLKYKNSHGSWTAQISLPNGKRSSKTFKTQREANQWRRQRLDELDTGLYIREFFITLYYKSHSVVLRLGRPRRFGCFCLET